MMNANPTLQNTSLKRYAAYKDSGVEWLGEIPEGWELQKFRYLFSFGRGLSITKEHLQETGIPCVNYGEIHSKYGFEVDPEKHNLKCVSNDYLTTSTNSLLQYGDFLFADTSEDISGSGNFTYLNSHEKVFAGYHTVIARPCNASSSRYMAYLFDSVPFRSQIQTRVKGVKVFSITQAILKDALLWLPPKEEQNRIVNFLDQKTAAIDTAIAKKQRLIELLKEQKAILINRAVTRGLNPEVPMKDSGVEWIGEIPAHWKTISVKRTATHSRKSFVDGDWVELPYITNTGVRLIQTGNIGIGKYKEKGFRYIAESSLKVLNCTEVFPNDILICRLDGPVGRACLAPNLGCRMITSVDNAILKPSFEFDSNYLVFVFSSSLWLDWIQAICRAGGGFRFRISRTMLGEQFVPFPPLCEQIKIKNYLTSVNDKVDILIHKHSANIQKLQEYKQTLIAHAVTGKIKVS